MELSLGNIVSVSTFEAYLTNNVIGFKSIEVGGEKMVNFSWCKLFNRHKNVICNNPRCKGNAKKVADSYIKGTCFIADETSKNNYTIWTLFFF